MYNEKLLETWNHAINGNIKIQINEQGLQANHAPKHLSWTKLKKNSKYKQRAPSIALEERLMIKYNEVRYSDSYKTSVISPVFSVKLSFSSAYMFGLVRFYGLLPIWI